MRLSFASCLVIILLTSLVSCEQPATVAKGKKGAMTALATYEAAMQELLSGDYVEAATLFEAIAGATLNPVVSQLALLRLGDALFFQGRYAEAAELFREFQEQFANSPDVHHAIYMRGLCFLRKMPEDNFILPPAESREMDDVENAYNVLSSLTQRAPDSYYAMRARFLLTQVVQRKCRHHLYVARFYSRNKKPLGVVQRIEQALTFEEREKKKGNVPATFMCASKQDVVLSLAREYEKAGNLEGLRRTLERYLQYESRYENAADGLKQIQEAVQRLEKAQPAK